MMQHIRVWQFHRPDAQLPAPRCAQTEGLVDRAPAPLKAAHALAACCLPHMVQGTVWELWLQETACSRL